MWTNDSHSDCCSMITIHEENHLGVECRKLKTSKLVMAEFVTIDIFKHQCECGFYHPYDCDALYACKDSSGNVYVGDSIDYNRLDGLLNIPAWCTHIFWTSK